MSARAAEIAQLTAQIPALEGLCPEQIIISSEPDTQSCLVDQWGRAHRLRSRTVVGREPNDCDIAVLESSVSRRHVEILYNGDTQRWRLTDLGSTNGVSVDGERVDGAHLLRDKQIVVMGEVGFVFLVDYNQEAAGNTGSIYRTVSVVTDGPVLRIIEASLGGSGIAEYEGQVARLGDTQLALLKLLSDRLEADADRPAEVRGFVRAVDLLSDLPWNTPFPDDNNAKQLIRRVRRALEKIGLANAIESKHGLGYRLTVTPHTD